MDSIRFQYQNSNYFVDFNKAEIYLGKILFIQINNNLAKISSKNFKNSTKVAVIWIATSVWTVSLVEKYYIDETEIQKVKETLKSHLTENQVIERLEYLTSLIKIENLYKSSEYDNSKLRNVLAVCDRLSFIDTLKSEEMALKIALNWNPLVMYHILTCFDLLGQPSKFITFDQWIISKSKKIERDTIIKNIPSNVDNLKYCENLYKEYLSIYGVKISFMRFIREMIPNDVKEELLNCIKISEVSMPLKNENIRKDISVEEKEKFLFQLRNNYTHKIELIYGFAEFLWPIKENHHTLLVQKKEEKIMKNYMIQNNWLEIFEKTIKIGLKNYLLKD